ncbi:MAG: metalloregulator ArsR/SmtB family transcription factor [Clostridiales bacterium]|nr:metalloregulator ArsR/SmtB family transcription factor [Clostridiales bacterium]
MDNNVKKITSLKSEQIDDLADLFKIFGDQTRIRIMMVLSKSESCVNDISNELGMTISAVSHQLRILKQFTLVKSRRDGKSIFYSLDDEHVQIILEKGIEHICE